MDSVKNAALAGLRRLGPRTRDREDMERQKGLFSRMWKHRVSYLFVLPYLLLFLVFTVTPVVISMFLGFAYFNGLQKPIFVGIENYLQLFLKDDLFIVALQNTLILAVITGPGGYLLSLIVAWFISDLPPLVRAVVTLVFYMPSISGNLFTVLTYFFSGDSYGFLNGTLLEMGLISSPIQFLSDANYIMGVVIAVSLWMSMGTGFLSFVAGFLGVDRGMYEAAAIDGIRNRWQELWYITLPSMKPQLMFGAVMSITGAFGVGSIVTGLVGFPSPGYAAHTIMHHLEDYGTVKFELGYSSAIATLLFLIMVGANVIIKRLISKVGEQV